MHHTTPDQLRQQINQAGAAATPFLFAVNYEMTEGFFIPEPLLQDEVYFQFGDQGNKPADRKVNKEPTLTPSPIVEATYQNMFDQVLQASQLGQVGVTNLTVRTPIATNLSEMEVFLLSNSTYQLYLPNRFVCFSPERFVRIERGRIASNPMKGTIDAAIPGAESKILNDPKELAEHRATVQLICDELMLVASQVRVERFRYIDRLETSNKSLLQVSSEVVGMLGDDSMAHMGDVLFKLLPAGSIAGSPKEAALDLIRQVEGAERGYYCGVAGYFDGQVLDTAVLIRFIECDQGQTYFHSGGGITKQSICKEEYQEVQNKIYLSFV